MEFLNGRMIKLKLKSRHADVTIIEAYAPTEGSIVEEKEDFYEGLQHLVDRTPQHDLVLVLGDFNAKVGNNENIWGKTLGKHGIEGDENENGNRLLEFCSNNNLCITNTQFIQKNCRKKTWTSPDKRTENLIDYIITREEWLTSVKKTRVYRSADIDSDHHLVIAEVKVKLSNKKITQKKRYNMEKLNNGDVQRSFEVKIKNRYEILENLTDNDTEKEWTTFKEAINQVAEEELGYTKRISQTWISKEAESLVEEIRKKKGEAQSNKGNKGNNNEEEIKLKEMRQTLRKKLSRDKNIMLGVANEMEEAYKKGDSKKLFANVNKMSGNTNNKLIMIEPIKEINGEIITERERIMERWKEHFEKLLNREEPINTADTMKEIEEMEQLQEEEDEMAEDIKLEEVEKAVKQMRRNKAPGVCKINAELLQNTGRHTIKWLHRVINTAWRTEQIPIDWRKAVIIPIHKKGSRQECDNTRGISLLSVPGKVFSRVILNRMTEKVNGVLRENQCGFRKGRGCSDQIFFLRQLIEKRIEFNEETVICFIDFAQAYDSIWRKAAWKVTGKYGIHRKITKMIENIYSTVSTCIRIEGEETDWFEVKTGFRQGCILSPILFNIVLDYIMRRLEKNHDLGATSEPINTEDAEYADDTTLIAESLIRILELLEALTAESEKFGLKINTKKTKIMPISKREDERRNVQHRNSEIEIVKTFTYLGSELKAEGGTENEIKRRIALAGTVFNRLQDKIFKKHDIKLRTKLRIFNTCVIPVLTYGSESWSITKTMESKLNATENKWLRRMLRIKYTKHITNEEIRETTRQPLISTRIRKIRLKWAGHVIRMEQDRNPKKMYEYKPKGKRARGRPKRRWIEGLEEDLKAAGASIHGQTKGRNRTTLEEMAKNRETWRDIIEKSMTGTSLRMET